MHCLYHIVMPSYLSKFILVIKLYCLVTLEAYPPGGTWHRRFVAVFIKQYKITRIKRTFDLRNVTP